MKRKRIKKKKRKKGKKVFHKMFPYIRFILIFANVAEISLNSFMFRRNFYTTSNTNLPEMSKFNARRTLLADTTCAQTMGRRREPAGGASPSAFSCLSSARQHTRLRTKTTRTHILTKNAFWSQRLVCVCIPHTKAYIEKILCLNQIN